MRVDALMTKNVISCKPQQPMADAARFMWECDCGCVPVVDENRRVVGMITDRDICMAALSTGKSIHDVKIQDGMSSKVLSCRPEDAIDRAEMIMKTAQVRRLPVIDGAGRLVGLLSLNDIARRAEREQASRLPEVALKEVALTLSAVCQPHQAAAE